MPDLPPDIARLVEAGQLTTAPREMSQAFADYVETKLPWNRAGTRLLWSEIGSHERLDLQDERALASWSRRVKLARYPQTLVIASADKGVVGDAAFVLGHIDEILALWKPPGLRYLAGLTESGELALDAIAEHDGVETVVATV